MIKTRSILFFSFLLGILQITCREEYTPPAIGEDKKLLIVEGFANSGQDSTTFTLSRTRKLVDTTTLIPELRASIVVEGENGGVYTIPEKGNGVYKSAPLPLQSSEKYRIRIRTSDQKSYTSDFVPVTTTPPVDSITWKRDNDIFIYVNTHDNAGTARFYRWEYAETWEYHSYYEGGIGYKNGALYYLDSSEQINRCWSSSNSTEILLGSSDRQSEDLIKDKLIATIPEGSEKLNFKYSILVRQYALTSEAFEYWQLLQKSSQEGGSIFDSQPAQLISNIHSDSNPLEPVIGFFSVSAIQEKRLYIRRSEVTSWKERDYSDLCKTIIFPAPDAPLYLADTSFAPAYYVSGGGLAIAKNVCVDCRRKGGTTEKPPYWQ
jgi:hypothetical protein